MTERMLGEIQKVAPQGVVAWRQGLGGAWMWLEWD